MKLKLYANREVDRLIAKMFVGCEVLVNNPYDIFPNFHKLRGSAFKLGGVDAYDFILSYETDLSWWDESITIDTDNCEMDLRLALGTEIEFEVMFMDNYHDLGMKERIETLCMTPELFEYLAKPDENFQGLKLSIPWLQSQECFTISEVKDEL